jgi:hypothetical protein
VTRKIPWYRSSASCIRGSKVEELFLEPPEFIETPQEKLKRLIAEARRIHSQEREVAIDSLRIIGTLAHWRAELYLGGKHEMVAKEIGLTPDQYFKRLRVAKLAQYFPQAIAYLREGRTSLSHLAMIGDKITQANELVIWDNIVDKGRREVEDFLRRVQPDGTVKERGEEMVTLQITVTAEEEALIHRLTEVLSACGHVPTTAEAIMTAVDKLLDQKDQLRRATKMAAKDAARAANKGAPEQEAPEKRDEDKDAAERATAAGQFMERIGAVADPVTATAAGQLDEDLLPRGSKTPKENKEARRRIPEAVKRAVYSQAEGRCQHVTADGSRCGATRMLEIDHVVPVALGGGDEQANLTLVCREHNQLRARLIMGHGVMDRYCSAGSRPPR